jgi:hypothetical protein
MNKYHVQGMLEALLFALCLLLFAVIIVLCINAIETREEINKLNERLAVIEEQGGYINA